MPEPVVQLTLAQLADFGRQCGREGAAVALEALDTRHGTVMRLVEQSGAHKTVLNTREAARYAAVSPCTIRRWIGEGLPATRRDGHAGYAIRREDIDAWRTAASPADAT